MKKFKNSLLVIILIILLSFSNICFAETDTNEENTSDESTSAVSDSQDEGYSEDENTDDIEDTAEESENALDSNSTESAENSENSDVTDEDNNNDNNDSNVSKDLYLSGDTIKIDKSVDGNVYILGKDVTVSGSINGNIFILANNVTFTDSSYIESSAYICAKKVNFNTYASTLYVTCDELNIPQNYGTFKDLYASCKKISLIGSIGRDAYISANEFTMSNANNAVSVGGNLNYSAPKELKFKDGSISGEIKYLPHSKFSKSSFSLSGCILKIINAILATSLIFVLFKFLLKASLQKFFNNFIQNIGKTILTGIISLILIPLVAILLMASRIATLVGFIILILYGLIIAILPYVFSITVANKLYILKNYSKSYIEYLIAIAISAIIAIFQMIPYFGFIISLIISIIGLGLIVYNLFSIVKNRKKLKV